MDIFTTSPRKLLAGAKPHVQGIRSRIGDLKFKGEDFRAHIGDAVILAAPLTRTMEGASTLKLVIHDPKGELRRSKLLESKFDVKVDDLWFRLAGITRPDHDTLELTFQARNVDRLRIAPGALKGKRGTYTRAEFWASQVVNEVKGPKIPLWIPELHEVQPIENASQARQASKVANVTRGKGLGTDAGGFDPSAKLTVKGIAATDEQLRNGEIVLSVGVSLNAPRAALLAVIMAGTQENNMTNTNSSGGCMNYFCFISQTAASFDGDYTDLAQTAHSFFTDGFGAGTGAIDYANQGLSPNDICASVENPAAQYEHLYGQWQDQAEEWVDAFTGGSVSGGTTVTTTKDYLFERKANETIWANGTRLFDEVNWRFFEAAGVIYVITEPELIASKIRMHVSDDAPGIDTVTFDYLVGKKLDQISVEGRARDWAAPPGTVAAVHQQGEQIDGRYLVSSIESDLLDPTDHVSVTLTRPHKPLPEPAPETSTKTIGGSSSGGSSNSPASGDLAGVSVTTTPGSPHWGGGADIEEQFVTPFLADYGISPGSGKRTPAENAAAGGSPTSDHLTTNTTSSARDYPTGDGAEAANALGKAMGRTSGSVGTFDRFSIEVDGHSFSVQILWAVPDHYDHIHVGIELA